MKQSKHKFAKLQVTGTNINGFINTCVNNDIEIKDVEKFDSKNIEITLNDYNLNKVKALNLQNYEMKILSPSQKSKFLHFLLYRLGLIIGIVASIVLLFFMQNRLININVYGVNTTEKREIIEKLEEYGIKKLSLMNFDKSDVEKYLYDNFDFSLVSIITKGNTLIISIKEELPDISKTYLPIKAEYNMVIKKLNVFAGTTNKKVGDVVFAGDTLVEPYIIQNGEKIDVTPCAEICGETYFSKSYNFKNTIEVSVRTGKSKKIEYEMALGKYLISKKSFTNDFENYQLEYVDNLISNYFLPIRINQTIAYETKTQIVERDFEKEKDEIIENLKKETYALVPENLQVDNEDIKINCTNYGNIVTIYLKSSVYLKYDNI